MTILIKYALRLISVTYNSIATHEQFLPQPLA